MHLLVQHFSRHNLNLEILIVKKEFVMEITLQ